jgi:hypothetical protein
MPSKEIIALAAAIMGGIFITHPFGFANAIRKVEFSILREVTRTDNWGNPSLYHTHRYSSPRQKKQPQRNHNASKKTSIGT